MKARLKTILRITGSVVIIALLVSRIQWDKQVFAEVFASIDLYWFLLSLTGVVLVLGVKSLRWRLLLKAEECPYSRLNSFIAYMASFTIGLITPGRLGEIARLYYVREDTGISFYRSFKTLVADRIFDFAILIWFGLTGMLYFYRVAGNVSAWVYLAGSAVFMLACWAVMAWLMQRFVAENSARTALRFTRETWNQMFERRMLAPWLLTLLAYVLFYSANYFIFNSISVPLSLIDIGFILSLMSLATLIPVSLAGFGTREASLVFLLSFYEVKPEVAIVFSLLQFTAFFLWGGIIGMVFWLFKPVKLDLIKEDYQAFLRFIKGQKQ